MTKIGVKLLCTATICNYRNLTAWSSCLAIGFDLFVDSLDRTETVAPGIGQGAVSRKTCLRHRWRSRLLWRHDAPTAQGERRRRRRTAHRRRRHRHIRRRHRQQGRREFTGSAVGAAQRRAVRDGKSRTEGPAPNAPKQERTAGALVRQHHRRRRRLYTTTAVHH